MKIILSAQDFGFGPTTQMFSLIKHLILSGFKGDIFIKRTATVDIFYEKNINDIDSSNIRLVDDLNGNYDKYIGFYDPEVIFEGKRKGKETIFLCNLTFLWKINNIPDTIDINEIDFSKIKNHHDLIILGYYLSDKVFIRSTDGIDKESILYQKIKDKTYFIGPIIYPKIFERKPKKFIMIDFLGQMNPISDDHFYDLYFKVIKKLIANIAIDKKIVVNSKLESMAKNIFKDEQIYSTLSQEEHQKILSECSLFLAPFGINSFFESSYYSVPTFILPEQHLGHIKSIMKYFGDPICIKNESFLFYNERNYNLEYEDEADFIKTLAKLYEEFLEDDHDNLLKENIIKNGDNLIIKSSLSSKINQDLNIFLDAIKK